MGEDGLSGLLDEVSAQQALLWLVVAMAALLVSLAGLFTFCTGRKHADRRGRRKKTDEPTPDDEVMEPETRQDQQRLPEEVKAELEAEIVREEEEEEEEEEEKEPLQGGTEAENQATTTDTITNNIGSEIEHQKEDAPLLNGHNEEEVEDLNETSEHANSEAAACAEGRGGGGEREEGGEGEGGERLEEVQNEQIEEVKGQTDSVATASLVNGSPSEHTQEQIDSASNEVAGVSTDGVMVNGDSDVAEGGGVMVNGDGEGVTGGKEGGGGDHFRWSFPPELDEFDLMESEVNPVELEQLFSDERMTELYLNIEPNSPGLGISIVGGSGSPSGDLPIIVKRVLPGSLAEKDGRLKTGDELVAMNDTLLVGVRKDTAIETLSNMNGEVRLLVLQDD